MEGFKLLRKDKKTGKLYPLFVYATEETPVNVWLDAKEGPLLGDGKVKSRLGHLAFRPGWHINECLPYVSHIYSIHEGKKYLKDGCVWCLVEFSDENNYQEEADANGINQNGKLIERDAYIKHIPVNGFYRYKTFSTMTGKWIIAGRIRIIREMSDEEVEKICRERGYEPLRRYYKEEQYVQET